MKRAIFTTAISLLCLEVVSCGYYRSAVPKEQRTAVELLMGATGSDGHSVSRYQAHPYFNYVGASDYRFKNGDSAHSPAGFRAQAPLPEPPTPGRLRIAAIGASTTYGMYFGKASSVWPELIEERLQRAGLPADAVSQALPAYTTYELLGVASMMTPSLRPDWVLIHTGMNDAFSVGFEDEGGPDNRHFRHDWHFQPPSAALLGIMRISHTVRILVMRGLPNLGDMITAMQYPAPKGPELERNMAAAEGKYFRRNIKTLVGIVRSYGAKPLLINMSLNPSFEARKDPYQRAVAEAVVRNNGIMASVGAELDVPVVDLYSKLRSHGLFLDAVHVNKAGMAAKADAISAALIDAHRAVQVPVVDDAAKAEEESPKVEVPAQP